MNISAIINQNISNQNIVNPSIVKSSQEVTNLINSYASQIKLMWILIIVILCIIFAIWLVWYVFFSSRYRVWIRMPTGKIEKFRFKQISNIVRITHHGRLTNGKRNKFDYIVDQKCVTDKFMEYFYRNPNPIFIDPGTNKATIEQQNIDQVLEGDTIQKFVMAHDLVGILKILAIITLIGVLLIILFNYMIYNHAVVCQVIQNVTQKAKQ